MAGTVRTVRAAAKSRPDKLVGKRRQTCRSIRAAMRALEDRFPTKTAVEIALRVGDGTPGDIRNAERWLAGTEPRAAELVELLQSDVGELVLVALMGEAKPKWWARNRRTTSLATARAEIEASQRRLAQLERELAE